MTKKWWQSSTVWLNVIALTVAILEQVRLLIESQDFSIAALIGALFAAANVLNRFRTEKAIRW